RAAAHCGDEMPEQAARDLRRKEHGRLARADATATEARERTFAGLAPDDLERLQIVRIARRREPVVALHVLAFLGEKDAAQAVARARVAFDEAMRVAVHPHIALRVDRRAFGIRDAG